MPQPRLLVIAAFLPDIAPIIEAIIDSPQPMQTGIHIGVPETFGGSLQKYDSIKAERISSELIIKGTYQTLLGFCLIMKKQAAADNSPKSRYAIVPPSSNE